MEPGIYDGLDADDYHASAGVSVSRLKEFAKAPAKARLGIVRETPALVFGSLLHTAVLEPEQLDRQYLATDLEREGTKAWAAAELAAGGRRLIKRAEWDQARRMRDAVAAHPVCREILHTGRAVFERSFYWVDERSGLLCHGRSDVTLPGMRVLADVKTCIDASEAAFHKTVGDLRYHWQEAHYENGVAATHGWATEAFLFFAIEKDFPHLIGVYEIDPADVDRGADDVGDLLLQWRGCEESGVWPGYSEKVERLPTLPRWAHLT